MVIRNLLVCCLFLFPLRGIAQSDNKPLSEYSSDLKGIWSFYKNTFKIERTYEQYLESSIKEEFRFALWAHLSDEGYFVRGYPAFNSIYFPIRSNPLKSKWSYEDFSHRILKQGVDGPKLLLGAYTSSSPELEKNISISKLFVEQFPDSSLPYTILGHLYKATEKNELAIRYLSLYGEFPANFKKPGVRNEIASILIELGDFRGCVRETSKAISMIDKKDTATAIAFLLHSYKMRAGCFGLLEKYEQAIEDYTAGIQTVQDYNSWLTRDINDLLGIYYFMRGVVKIDRGFKEDIDSACDDLSTAGSLGEDLAYEYIRKFCR